MEIPVARYRSLDYLRHPGSVRRERYFTCRVAFTIVDVQLQRFAFVAFDQGEQIFGIAEQRIGSNDVIRIRAETGECRWRMLLHIEYVPHILVGFIEGTEAKYLNRADLRKEITMSVPHWRIACEEPRLPAAPVLVRNQC